MEREDCIAVHEMMLARDGGLAGLRDEGLLASALAKPQHLHTYGFPNLAELSASYAAGIVINHPFVDGNKRTGFVMAAMFLEINGLIFAASEESVVEKTLKLASGELKQPDYAKWLEENSRPEKQARPL